MGISLNQIRAVTLRVLCRSVLKKLVFYAAREGFGFELSAYPKVHGRLLGFHDAAS